MTLHRMKDILDDIIANKRREVEESKKFLPPKQLYSIAEKDLDVACPSMRESIMASPTGIIAEFKRKSPSKGWIKQEGRADDIPLSYQNNGAAAISILTDNKYFGGYDEHIQIARMSGVTIPILYKNFIIDEYQLFMARHAGASAVLLIAACLSVDECRTLMHTSHELGMEVLLEMHSREELDYSEQEPDMCGINNRNLGTFTTDVENSFMLCEALAQDTVKVSESGISNPETIRELRKVGFNGFLIGETFMKKEHPGRELLSFINNI